MSERLTRTQRQTLGQLEQRLYLALDTSGDWARSEFPDELLTFDFNSKGKLIGVEAIGSAAEAGIDALVKALTKNRSKAVKERLGAAQGRFR